MIFFVVYVNLVVKNLLIFLVYMCYFIINFFGDDIFIILEKSIGVRNVNFNNIVIV